MRREIALLDEPGLPAYLPSIRAAHFQSCKSAENAPCLWQMDLSRHIYMNVPHSANPKALMVWAESFRPVYEGDTLVATPSGKNSKSFHRQYPHSPQPGILHVSSAFHLRRGPANAAKADSLSDDPSRLTQPLHVMHPMAQVEGPNDRIALGADGESFNPFWGSRRNRIPTFARENRFWNWPEFLMELAMPPNPHGVNRPAVFLALLAGPGPGASAGRRQTMRHPHFSGNDHRLAFAMATRLQSRLAGAPAMVTQ